MKNQTPKPLNITKAKKTRKRFLIAAIIFGVCGLLSIPTGVWAIVYLIIAFILSLRWASINAKIKTAEKEGTFQTNSVENHWEEKKNEKSVVQETDEDDIAQQAYDAVVNERRTSNLKSNKDQIYHLKYRDAQDEVSERDIQIHNIELGIDEQPSYINAYCFLRQEIRQFRVDRIVSLYTNNERIKNPREYLADKAMEGVLEAKHKPQQTSQPQNADVDYTPLENLCEEIQNFHDNNYLSLEPSIPVEIQYFDRDGKRTKRTIDIQYIARSDYDAGYYISAFCHLRNEKRSFNIERIEAAWVKESEIDLIRYIVDTYRKTDEYNETVLSIKINDLLNSDSEIGNTAKILTYISRIDGVFTAKEKTTIAAFLKELNTVDTDIEIEDYRKGLVELKPMVREFKKSVKSLSISDRLIEVAQSIVGKDSLRQGAFEIVWQEYEKNNTKQP